MRKELEEKTALITGSSRGIGRAIALELARRGASIVLNYVRNEEAAAETSEEVRAMGVSCESIQANVGDAGNIKELVAKAVEKTGGIDILIHNAAMGAFKPVHKLRQNQWDLSFEINTKGLLLLVQEALPSMQQRGGGQVIALSSLGARQFIPNYGAIGISKAGIESLVRYLAVELAGKNIRVNAVSGGLVETDAMKFYPDFQGFRDQVVKRTPAGRIGRPEDLARVVAFLTSEDARWIIGQTIIADGGLSLI